MSKVRLEAFSDGVIAILITIMVLELKVPHGTDGAALRPLLPVFLAYVLSFVYLGIYWNNHHHMLHACDARQRRRPVGQPAPPLLALARPLRDGLDGREPLRPPAHRGLRRRDVPVPPSPSRSCSAADRHCRARNRVLAEAVRSKTKEMISLAAYAAAMPLAFVNEWISHAIYVPWP